MAEQKNSLRLEYLRRVLVTAAILAIASGIGYLFRYVGFHETNIVVVYLLAVLMTAWLTRGYFFGFLASILATFLFNYFFAEPLFSLSVNNPNHVVTFVIMTATALITSTLTSHAQRATTDAREKEAQAKAIFDLNNLLTAARDIHDIAGIAAGAISESLACNAACLCFNENNMPESTFVQQVAGVGLQWRQTGDIDEINNHIDGNGADWYYGTEFYDWPIYGQESILGVIRIPNESSKDMTSAQKRLLNAMVESTAFAMDRLRSMAQHLRARAETARERYHANLLRSISHDLRTPLSGMLGTTEMLLDMTEKDDPRYGLLNGVQKDADWLYSLVENILNLTRLQDGKLTVDKQLEAAEEVISVAISHVVARAPEHKITVQMPDELLLVPMDARLIEQVLINLIENAIKHTEPDAGISVIVAPSEDGESVVFTVADRGTGIRNKDLPNIFKTFYTSDVKHVDSQQGIGLGLPICETIVKAHGGDIQAVNRTDGPGVEFSFTLPLEAEAEEAADETAR
ncbi:MAG: DUF4118 domain-containing protein [Eggerthellaceae bacterium]|nr:DUF4118 domain-containing protein [Eggerthellaceae bacterium]